MKPFGWWVDLTGATLSDTGGGAASTWVHALPFGTYQHPLHGEMHFDAAKLTALATSVKSNVRGIDPDIDYDHKADPAKGHQAAGWVKDAEVRENGLFLKVDFTSTAAGEVKDKKYRYFSAEFVDEWTDPTGVKHQDVLLGGGLTNRPYMKNLLPVNLSELRFDEPPQKQEENEVDGKKLRVSLGLAETATDDEVFAKLGEMATTVTTLSAEKTKLEDELKQFKEPPPTLDPELKKLVEASPAMKKLVETLEAQQLANQELTTALRLAETDKLLGEIQTGTTYALSPVVKDELKALMLKASPTAAKELAEFMGKITSGTGLVDLSEKGFSGRRAGDVSDANIKLGEAVRQLMEADKNLTYADAVEHVSAKNPTLFAEYREAAYSFKS
jgi:phage I-like protein